MRTKRISRQHHAPQPTPVADELLHVSPSLLVRIAWSTQRNRWVWLEELDEIEDVSCDRPTTIANVLGEPLVDYAPRMPAARRRPRLLPPQLSWMEMLDPRLRGRRPGSRAWVMNARSIIRARKSQARADFSIRCWESWRARLVGDRREQGDS